MSDVDRKYPTKLDKESWVSITEWRGHQLKPWYKISDHGRAIKIKNNQSYEMPQTICSGYRIVQFRTIDQSNINEYTHRLVASLFLKNSDPEKYVEVNHIDGNKLNNCVSNLEWVTHRQNVDHAIRTGLAKGCPGNSVINVDTQQIFSSVAAASKYLGRWNGYVKECIDHNIKCTSAINGQKYTFAIVEDKIL